MSVSFFLKIKCNFIKIITKLSVLLFLLLLRRSNACMTVVWNLRYQLSGCLPFFFFPSSFALTARQSSFICETMDYICLLSQTTVTVILTLHHLWPLPLSDTDLGLYFKPQWLPQDREHKGLRALTLYFITLTRQYVRVWHVTTCVCTHINMSAYLTDTCCWYRPGGDKSR